MLNLILIILVVNFKSESCDYDVTGDLMKMLPKRDFIGYGPTPPNPKWPGEAHLAINFVVNIEEGSEASFNDGYLLAIS